MTDKDNVGDGRNVIYNAKNTCSDIANRENCLINYANNIEKFSHYNNILLKVVFCFQHFNDTRSLPTQIFFFVSDKSILFNSLSSKTSNY